MGPTSTADHESAPLVPINAQNPLLGLALTAAPALLFVAGVLVPYYANDLHTVALAEVAGGAHDPRGLWPQGPAAGWVQLAAVLATGLVPVGAVVGASLSITAIARGARGDRDTSLVAHAALVLVLSLAVLAAYLSPAGSALVAWRLD